MKWKEKNRFRVALPTENPPQIQKTIVSPNLGIEEIRLVITVAPQKDICPQGKIYPIKATIIKNNKIKIPLNHTIVFLKEK